MAECSVSPRNAAERKERDEARYRHFGPEIKKALDKERAKNERLIAHNTELRAEVKELRRALDGWQRAALLVEEGDDG